MVHAGRDNDSCMRKLPLEFPESFARPQGARLRDLIPAVQQKQEWLRLLYLREFHGRQIFGLKRRFAGNKLEHPHA